MAGPITAVLFDFGGVFTDSPFGAVRAFGPRLGVSGEHLEALVFGSYAEDTDHPWHCLERGEISLEQARDGILELGAAVGLQLDIFAMLGQLAQEMKRKGGGINQRLVSFVEELAPDYTLGIVTNNVREFSAAWRSLLPVDELFDFVVDSSELGRRKPDAAIYRHALVLAGLEDPSRALFLDDFAGNVAGATAAGLRGLLVDGGEDKTIGDLRRQLAGTR